MNETLPPGLRAIAVPPPNEPRRDLWCKSPATDLAYIRMSEKRSQYASATKQTNLVNRKWFLYYKVLHRRERNYNA